MRTIHRAFLAGGLALLLGAGLAATSIAATQSQSAGAATPPAPTATMDDTRATDLTYSRDEERMAMDLYTLFGQTYNAAIFTRIAASEQQHFDAVGTMLTTYAIADPAVGQPAGTYANMEVQKLYDQWKTQGLTSVQDAYAVGVALEQADIADLQGMLDRNPDADVQQMFSHLLTASRHHLTAFTNAVDGGTDPAFCGGSGARLRTGDDDHRMEMGDGTGMGTGYQMGPLDN